jgi:threonine/homoserine/homoserine lactone efflux protein
MELPMIDAVDVSANLVLAYSTYALGTASPGPSNLAVMATAMNGGRKPALALALGVVSGSACWGLLAAFGLSAVLASYASALFAMKILGGLYLLWLAARSARAAWSVAAIPAPHADAAPTSYLRTYLRGAGLHLTNPKAIFVWLSIVSLALPAGAQTRDALPVVLGCAVLGLAVFCGYAIAFSTSGARRIYRSLRRWFEGTLAVLFAYAGFRTLASSR